MRRTPPLIIGAGPAGCAAAIALAGQGIAATVLERDREVRDAICGGFMSWRTLATLDRLGVVAGGHPIRRVVVFADESRAEAALPAPAVGVSRRALDTIMQATATSRGVGIERGREVKAIEGHDVRCGDGTMIGQDAIFLAVGKHDLRGRARPRDAADPALGLRVRIAPHPALAKLIADAIELHMFDRGYVGINLQEDGSANVCLAVRKSRLAEAGGRPDMLLAEIAGNSALGDRLAFADAGAVDAIAAIPYGWRARSTEKGLFLLGDQAAVIPSLAGEGIGIAIASGIAAARAFAEGGAGAAPRFQMAFAARTRRPVAVAGALWHGAERAALARRAVGLMRLFPALADVAARATRLGN